MKHTEFRHGLVGSSMNFCEQVSNLHIIETGKDTLALEWTASGSSGKKTFSIVLKCNGSDAEIQKQSVSTEGSMTNKIQFAGLKPFTEYSVTVSTSQENHPLASVQIMTRPSLEMPEIEEVQEGCAHLTLSPLPEDEAKNALDYLLLVQPLEDVEHYPNSEIKTSSIQAALEEVVKPPFYIAYEFTQEQLSQEGGGEILIGSGLEKRDGKYGTLQDPKLQSGAFYKVAFIVVMIYDGKQKMYSKESCRMLIK